jgi:hypothetical protein
MRTLLLVLTLIATAWSQDMPDLVVHVPTLAENAHEDLKPIAPTDCTLQPSDLCVDAPGTRRLLRFSVLALNRGTADLVVGAPSFGDPKFVYSECHKHFHFESFARYELRERGGSTVVKTGQKRSFCIEDLKPDPDAPFSRPCGSDADCQGHGMCASNGICLYNCNYQGIQPGRGDIYDSSLDCQWIDTTDVPPGEYDLWVLLNTEQLLPESDYTNDSATVPVTVGPAVDAPVPTVKVHAKKKARVGKNLKVAWHVKIPGGKKNLALQDVWLSRDGGATFPELLATGLLGPVHTFKWPVAGDATEQAVVKVVTWSKAFQRGEGTTKPLRIVP